MRIKIALTFFSLIILNSCVVKSLQPFYSQDKLSFNEAILGNWKDQNNGMWEIVSFKTEWEKENLDQAELPKEDRATYENYKQGYVVKYIKNKKEALFIAMPFLIEKELFLDLTPFQYESDELNSLAAQHLLKTHSAAKVDFQNNGFFISFLSEERINPLFSENKIKLKHERTGIDEDLILTASPTELYEFLKKFKNSAIENKWTEDQYRLEPYDVGP